MSQGRIAERAADGRALQPVDGRASGLTEARGGSGVAAGLIAEEVPTERAPFEVWRRPPDAQMPDDLTAPVALLADFALKLSIGPVSRSWVPAVRRSAEALLLTGKHRHETALAALSARLLSLLPASERMAPSADGEPPIILGETRAQILHEMSRLAGILPEWPAPAQDLAEEARRRETRVIRELLAMVDGFKRDQRARIEEQLGLEELAAMPAAAIAEEFDVPLERASELELLLSEYRRSRKTRAPDLGNVRALGRAIDELANKSREFDASDADQKERQRSLRLERRLALSAVNLLLAERGDFEWLDQLEPLAIGERVERLEQLLQSIRFESDGLEPSSEGIT